MAGRGKHLPRARASSTAMRLSERPTPPYHSRMDVTLPPDLERFAAEAVATGRFRDFSDLVVAGIGLLRRTEGLREQLLTSVQTAERNGERDGFLTVDEVMSDADAVIAEMAGKAQ